MKRLDTNTFGPWAIITGASSGIGEEFARQLAASGLNLVLVARRLWALEALGNELAQTFGIQYRAIELDLATDDVLAKLSEATRDLDLGLVISNAGAMAPGDFLLMNHQALRRDLHLNVQAHLDLAHHFGQRLAQHGRGGLLLVALLTAVYTRAGIELTGPQEGCKLVDISSRDYPQETASDQEPDSE